MASRQHQHLVPIQKARVWNQPFPTEPANRVLEGWKMTKHNRKIGEQAVANALIGNDGPKFCPWSVSQARIL